MDYSVVLFDLKTEGAPSEKPLMLQPVLFCPVLTWVCQELRACGAQRFFAVCDADAREEVLAAAEGFDLTCVDSAEEALAQVQGGVIAVPGAVVPAAGEPSRAVYAADAGELRAVSAREGRLPTARPRPPASCRCGSRRARPRRFCRSRTRVSCRRPCRAAASCSCAALRTVASL